MLQQYVNTKFRVKRRGKETIIDDYDAIKEIEEKHRATVMGTAGCGKTIFMRYLWISLFTSIDPHIPIFVELRRLNSLSTLELESFVFHSISQITKKLIFRASRLGLSRDGLLSSSTVSTKLLQTGVIRSKSRFWIYAERAREIS